MIDKPVFFDASGRRSARMSLAGRVTAIAVSIVGAVFIASLLIEPHIASPTLPGRLSAVRAAELERRAADPGLLKAAARLAAEARAERAALARSWKQKGSTWSQSVHGPAGLRPRPDRPLSIGFYLSTDDLSYPDLKRNGAKLDWFVPAWLNLQGPNLTLAQHLDRHALSAIAETNPSMVVLPMVQNASNAVWDGPGLAKLLADPQRRHVLLNGIVSFVANNKFQGAVVDFEELPQSAYPDLQNFLTEMSAAFSPHGWIIVLASPFDDDNWPYADYAKLVDYTLLMAYDEHDNTGEAGSIASQSWFEENLDNRMRVLSPSRTIIGIGNYGYDWTEGHPGDAMTFEDAAVAARDSQAQIVFDDQTNNPHFSYMEDDNTKHDVWFLDAVTAFNQIHAADVYEPAGYALWKIGSEDPSLWSVMGRKYNATSPAGLRDIPTTQDVDFEGQGEVLRVEAQPTPGTRAIEVDKDTGDIDDETYTKLPTTFVIRQAGYSQTKLALTFDDGPDPEYTPEILDILKAKHVTATFFIIGENAEAYPGLVQRMLAEGHEVGNHTFTHPNLADTADPAVALELNATQRLFQALTGRSLRLFRPPYIGDAAPASEAEIEPVEIAQDLGYVTVGIGVDPVDWQLPGVDAMLRSVFASLHSKNVDARGSMILLHDSGGDRSQTVAMLPVLIDRLRAQGYKLVPVSELAGISREQANPRLPVTATLFTDRIVFLTLSWLGAFLYYCFVVAIALGIARLLVLCSLAIWNSRREAAQFDDPVATAAPLKVSVIIPAFNEEKVIGRTIERILGSTNVILQVVVVDDGSRDGTAELIRKRFGSDGRVELISVPNGGKARALNVGLAHAKGDVVVALDADTQFEHDTIARLARWFTDPRVGAVAGNAKVGNRINIITRWQALEYIVAQNLERRALAALDTLTVVPGAVGAWRRSLLSDLGGFPSNTLAEDQDLTIAIQKAGFEVLFDASAVAWTEAPSTVRGFAKQRFRWAFGTLQCLWKYRGLTFNPRYGWLGFVALPQAWMFQILLTALAPVADLMLIWQLLGQGMAYLEHGAEFSNASLGTVGIYYCVFMVVDLLAATCGFILEKKENWNLIWWLLLQRFGYRQLMYYVVVRSISTAFRGTFVGWSKLERTGTVNVQYARDALTHRTEEASS
jgi:cellulose synthase/poly-beta-1,6-N-acetylglucosamine synthase-like glycosyltransferase/peptidoglycan/xylan/chitin deacetylase (PgdA/CDA1 family)/spore germination protein YaaH